MKRKWPSDKVVSIMTICAVCRKNITKKNFEDGIFLCDECINLSVEERISKTQEKLLNDYIDLLDDLVKNEE